MSNNLNVFSWRSHLEYIRSFPCVSSTLAVVHASSLANRLNEIAKRQLAFTEEAPAAPKKPISIFTNGINLSTEAISHSTARVAITYLALQPLSSLSLCVNGIVGAGKIGLSLMMGLAHRPATQEYKEAQGLLEQGVFHLASGIADFCLGKYRLISAGLALFHGIAPCEAQSLIGRAFIWKRDINTADEAGQEAIDRDRQNYSWLQILADKAQRLILPDLGATRVEAFYNKTKAAFSSI